MERLRQLEIGLKDAERFLAQAEAEKDSVLVRYFDRKIKIIMNEIEELLSEKEDNLDCVNSLENSDFGSPNTEFVCLQSLQLRTQYIKAKEEFNDLVKKIHDQKIAQTKEAAEQLNKRDKQKVLYFILTNEGFIYSQIRTKILKEWGKQSLKDMEE